MEATLKANHIFKTDFQNKELFGEKLNEALIRVILYLEECKNNE